MSGLTAAERQCHNLNDLKAGKYQGYKRLQLVENLSEFPEEILSLSNTLEVLDLSNNLLSELPDSFVQLKNLKVLFLSFNQFKVFPDVLGKCINLDMVGFKSNQIESISETSLPRNLRWLILTDNRLTQLPHSFGQLSQLKKLALAGNKLASIPESFTQCKQLELVRLSANELTSVPAGLFKLPKLAWLALSGNPLVGEHKVHSGITQYEQNDIVLNEQIGQGASGVIYQGKLTNADTDTDIAIKVFKGGKTSDGYPEDELNACLTAGQHENLINTFAHISEPDFLALLMDLIPKGYENLGLPPNYETCTRDTFVEGTQYSIETISNIAKQLADVLSHLHNQQVSHGDFYAHNTMINEQGHVMFGDFGAATQLHNLSGVQQQQFERIEVRAFGNLLDDLLKQSQLNESDNSTIAKLISLRDACLNDNITLRPNFADIKVLLAE
ncbi:protein kinase [Pseudoalteromonas phenolica]|uniref:Protein kinase n=1 Tax=Pseudoalteromonas phenolica TaxID=161398 RepID=A0A5R9Q119_9GAMM|nr:protein kinase [Pseudoalteromonas phenolica]